MPDPAPKPSLPSPVGTDSVDRTLRALHRAIGAYVWMSTGLHRRTPPSRVADGTIALVVAHRRIVAHDQNVVELTLTAAGGGPLPPWHPGAHLDLHLPSGRRRQYSLCGDPADRASYRIAVRLIPDGDGGSLEVHRTLTETVPVIASGPRNAFAFVAPGHGSPARRLRLIAGGIGITPILPMARLADRLGVDWTLVHTGRSRDTMPFADEVAQLGPRATVRTDDADGLPSAAELLGDTPTLGDPRTPAPMESTATPEGTTAVYCCGPPPMVAGLLSELRERTDTEFHFERFGAPSVRGGKPFTVELTRSGRTIEVPADRSALAAILDEQPQTPYSCRQGYCRTCKVTALAGSVDHRDTTLTADERARGEMLICVSRSDGGTLSLDM